VQQRDRVDDTVVDDDAHSVLSDRTRELLGAAALLLVCVNSAGESAGEARKELVPRRD
jgi:hypothetical protein